MRSFLVTVVVVAVPTSAFALDQSVHKQISYDACVAAGLGDDFCERVGTEAYNVDSYEWRDPAAHAQIPDYGSTACAAANATVQRVRWLGQDIRESLTALASSPSENLATHIATQLGRSLHTIQDSCAHKGMDNLQHAWLSRMDTCNGTSTSPDADPAAAECGRTETAAAFDSFVLAMNNAGVSPGQLDGISSGWTHWPARGDVCSFLHSADQWNGTDTRWEGTVVIPWLTSQLAHVLIVDDSMIGDACADGGQAISAHYPAARVDTSTPAPWCWKLKTYCVGKADAPDEAPPWAAPGDDEPGDQAGGCSATAGGSSPVLVLWVFGMIAVASRRRRSRR